MPLVMSKAKWLIPLIVIVAMLAAVGLVWSQSSGGDDGGFGGLPQSTDQNPAYDDEIVAPSETAVPIVLYTITMDPQTSVIAMCGGDVTTVTLTNNIGEAINNGGYTMTMNPATGIMEPVGAIANGDITGDVVVTADVYNVIHRDACLTTYRSNATAEDGGASGHVIVKIARNITVHPGGSVSFIIPVVPGTLAVPGAEFLLKAALYLPGTVTGMEADGDLECVSAAGGIETFINVLGNLVAQFKPIPWMPGYVKMVDAGAPGIYQNIAYSDFKNFTGTFVPRKL